MGLFNLLFSKKHNDDAPVNESVSEVSSKPMESPTGDRLSANVKQTIADFFKTDILNLSENDYRERVILNEADYELGMFHYVDVSFRNGKVNNITFSSLFKHSTPEFREFIDRCALTFGPTKSGESQLTANDLILIMRGRFSRLWKNLWIDCGPDEEDGLTAIRITIFSPETTGNIILNLQK